jgi:hypothetical protein
LFTDAQRFSRPCPACPRAGALLLAAPLQQRPALAEDAAPASLEPPQQQQQTFQEALQEADRALEDAKAPLQDAKPAEAPALKAPAPANGKEGPANGKEAPKRVSRMQALKDVRPRAARALAPRAPGSRADVFARARADHACEAPAAAMTSTTYTDPQSRTYSASAHSCVQHTLSTC